MIKKILPILLLIISSNVSAQVYGNEILNVHSIELIYSGGPQIGLVYSTSGEQVDYLTVICQEKDTLKQQRPYVCVEIPVITQVDSVGLAFILGGVSGMINPGLGFKNINGKKLRDLFGNYWGVQGGFGLLAGAETTPFLINKNRVFLRNILKYGTTGAQANISAARFRVAWPKDSNADQTLLDKVIISN